MQTETNSKKWQLEFYKLKLASIWKCHNKTGRKNKLESGNTDSMGQEIMM